MIQTRQRCVWSSSKQIPAHRPAWSGTTPLKLLDCQNKSEWHMNGGCTPQPSLWASRSNLTLVCVSSRRSIATVRFQCCSCFVVMGSVFHDLEIRLLLKEKGSTFFIQDIWPVSFSWRCGRWVTMEITPRLWRSGWSHWSWETTPRLSSSMATPPWNWWRRSGRSSSSTWVLFLSPPVWYFTPQRWNDLCT